MSQVKAEDIVQDDEAGKLFVGGLSWETSQEKLKDYFSCYGEVVDCVVMKNTTTGRSRGFGFVSFKDPNCVAKVLSSSPHEVDGRTIDPKVCNARSAQQKKKAGNYPKVFLGGLPPNCTETDIRSFFSRYGRVVEVVLMYDQEKKKTRGFGFLSFETEDSVKQVCAEHFVTINGKQVECKHAEPRDKGNRTQPNNVPPNQWAGPGAMGMGGPGWGPAPGAMGPGMGPGGPPGPMGGPMGGPMNNGMMGGGGGGGGGGGSGGGGGYQGGWGGPQQPGPYGPQGGGWGPQQGGGYGPGYQNWGGGPGYGPYGGPGPQYGQQGYGGYGPGNYGGGNYGGGYNGPMGGGGGGGGGGPANSQPPANDGYSGPGANGPSVPAGPQSGPQGGQAGPPGLASCTPDASKNFGPTRGGTQTNNGIGSYSQEPSNYGPARGGTHGNGYGGGPGNYGGQGNYGNQGDAGPQVGRSGSQNAGYHPYRR